MAEPTKPAQNPKSAEPSSEQLKSPLKPLLWLLIPLVAVMIYGFFN